jgi:lysine-N-methylase
MPSPVRSLTVLQNWDCQGCTDCCRQYRVQVSADEKARIDAQGWDGDPALQGVKCFVRDDGWFSGQYRLNQTDAGNCVFLDENGRCRIHAKFGSDAKPLACRVYPFVLVRTSAHWRVGLRFACPSAANDAGRPITAHESALAEFAAALEEQGDRQRQLAIAAPVLQRGQTVPWSDVELFISAFQEFLQNERRPLEWRLRKCLAVIELCRQARFEKVSGERLREFLAVIGDGVNPDVPARPEAVGSPSRSGRILFRQMMYLYARKDSGFQRGVDQCGRLSLVQSALKFLRGSGRVPRVHAAMPETTFERIENPAGPLPEASTKTLTRYYRVKIDSGQFFGPNNFGRRFWDGLETLILTYPVIVWLGRALHDRPKEEAIVTALRIVDDNFGYNRLLGGRRQMLVARKLARRGDLARLIAWYSR